MAKSETMKKSIYLVLLLLYMANNASAQVLRAMTPRYSNPSVKGNIVYVANNIITSQGVVTTELPPGGTAVNNGNLGANVDIEGPLATTFIPYGDNWRCKRSDPPGGLGEREGWGSVN